MARSDWYYEATANWSNEALAAHANKYFNGYEHIGNFATEEAARAALAPHLERPEIVSGGIFCQRDLRGNQIEQKWRKTVDKPGHVDTPLQAMIRDALTNPDGTDYMERG